LYGEAGSNTTLQLSGLVVTTDGSYIRTFAPRPWGTP
jgi:hypothetical protein